MTDGTALDLAVAITNKQQALAAWNLTWNAFKTRFRQQFISTDSVSDAFKELQNIKQQPNEKVDDYIHKFQRLAREANINEFTVLYAIFKNGLLRQTKSALLQKDIPVPADGIQTMDPYYEAARKIGKSLEEVYQEFRPSNRLRDRYGKPFERTSYKPRSNRFHRRRLNEMDIDSDSELEPEEPETLEESFKLYAMYFKKLSKEERQKAQTDGLCFYCGKAGHFANKCPTRPPRPDKFRKPFRKFQNNFRRNNGRFKKHNINSMDLDNEPEDSDDLIAERAIQIHEMMTGLNGQEQEALFDMLDGMPDPNDDNEDMDDDDGNF